MKNPARYTYTFLGLLAAWCSSANAQLTITANFGSTIAALANSNAIMAAINTDITTLQNDVTTLAPVSVSINFVATNSGLAQSVTPEGNLAYSTYLADLQANPNKSVYDTTALATMPAGPSTTINGATYVYLTAANLAAIGATNQAATLVSGNGGFNSTLTFNFSILNATRPTTNGMYDLQTAAMHEIDEVLGIGGNATTLYQPGATAPSSLPTNVGPLDFFRYSTNGVRSFTYDSTATAYFSINGGTNNLVNFNQRGANGSDFGDWGNGIVGSGSGNTPPQVQDAFGTANGMANLGPNELIGFDVIGYNLTTAGLAVVPEPGSVGILLGGLAAFGIQRRLRKTRPSERRKSG